MSKKTILSKSAICGSVYLIFPFLILLVVYGLDTIITNPFVVATLFGAICGTIIAVVTNCGELKRTSIARAFGILAVIVVELLLEIFGVQSKIILYIFRNTEFVRETGRLTVNETIGYSWSMMFFWFSMIISLVVVCVGIFVYNIVKTRRTKQAGLDSQQQ